MKLGRYPSYKNSKVESLGLIPEHWTITRLKSVATVKARLGWKGLKAEEYIEEGYIFLATPNIKGEAEIDFEKVNFISDAVNGEKAKSPIAQWPVYPS